MNDAIPLGYARLDEARVETAAALRDVEQGKRSYVAIGLVWQALANGELEAVVRAPKTGELCRIPGDDWRRTAFWHQIVAGGRIRAPTRDPLEIHNGCVVLIKQTILERWLRNRQHRRVLAATADCYSWLAAQMRAAPDNNPKPKQEWKKETQDRFEISGREFDRAWASCLRETEANWGRPGRKSKRKN